MTARTITLFLAVNHEGETMIDYDSADSAVAALQESYDCAAVRTLAIAVTLDLPVLELVNVSVPPGSKQPADVAVS